MRAWKREYECTQVYSTPRPSLLLLLFTVNDTIFGAKERCLAINLSVSCKVVACLELGGAEEDDERERAPSSVSPLLEYFHRIVTLYI